jgi:hypothetical protein
MRLLELLFKISYFLLVPFEQLFETGSAFYEMLDDYGISSRVFYLEDRSGEPCRIIS